MSFIAIVVLVVVVVALVVAAYQLFRPLPGAPAKEMKPDDGSRAERIVDISPPGGGP